MHTLRTWHTVVRFDPKRADPRRTPCTDRIGRNKIMVAGCALAAAFYLPIYHAIVDAANTGVVRVDSARNAIGERTLAAFNAAGERVEASTASTPTTPSSSGWCSSR